VVGGAPEARVESGAGAETPRSRDGYRASRVAIDGGDGVSNLGGGARVGVEAGFDPALLRQVVEAFAIAQVERGLVATRRGGRISSL
jgi:hypothetical protein